MDHGGNRAYRCRLATTRARTCVWLARAERADQALSWVGGVGIMPQRGRGPLGEAFAEYCSRPRVLSPNPTGKVEFAQNQNTGTRPSLCLELKRGFGTHKKGLHGRTETVAATWLKLC